MESWQLTARESIRDTIASYTYFADRGRFEQVGALFTAAGILEVEGIGGARAEGRDAILDFFNAVGREVSTSAPPGRMQHHVASVWIDVPSTEDATASSYFTVMTGAGVDHWGRYRDRFTREGDRWLFAHRLVTTDGTTDGGWAATR